MHLTDRLCCQLQKQQLTVQVNALAIEEERLFFVCFLHTDDFVLQRSSQKSGLYIFSIKCVTFELDSERPAHTVLH